MSTDDEARQVYQARREAEEAKYSELNVKTELAREEGIAQGIEKGAKKAKLETAKNLINIGLSVEQISTATGLSKEEIIQLTTSKPYLC